MFQVSWLVFGDFNEVISNTEKLSGALRSFNQMNNFYEAISDCQVLELYFTRWSFTWTHSCGADMILERLIAF